MAMRAARLLGSVLVVAGLGVPSTAWAATDDDSPPPWAAASCSEELGECHSWRDQHRAVMHEWREARADIFARWRAGELTTQERDALLDQARADRTARNAELREARQAAKEAWRLERGEPAELDLDVPPDDSDSPDDSDVRGGRGADHGKGNGNGRGNGHGDDAPHGRGGSSAGGA